MWMSITPLISLIPGVVMMLILGPFADVYGKKKTIVLLPVVYFVQSIVFLILVHTKLKFSAGTFIIASCLSGMFGDNAGLELVCVAYLADISYAEERTSRATILEASMLMGSIGACLLSGVLLRSYGFASIFITTAIINVINFIYVTVILPDEKNMERILSENGVREDPLYRRFDDSSPQLIGDDQESSKNEDKNGGMLEACNPYKCFGRIRTAVCSRGVGLEFTCILMLMVFAQIANMGELYVGVLYVKHAPFNLKSNEIGYLAATQNLVRALGMVFSIYICQKLLKCTDIGLVILGFSSQVFYFCVYGSSVSNLMLYLSQLVGLAASLHIPVLRSMASKLVSEDEHGSALAVVEAVDVGSSILASLVSNTIYSITVGVYTGLTLYVLGLSAFIGAIFAITFMQATTKSLRARKTRVC